jgi:hypothetical protein
VLDKGQAGEGENDTHGKECITAKQRQAHTVSLGSDSL